MVSAYCGINSPAAALPSATARRPSVCLSVSGPRAAHCRYWSCLPGLAGCSANMTSTWRPSQDLDLLLALRLLLLLLFAVMVAVTSREGQLRERCRMRPITTERRNQWLVESSAGVNDQSSAVLHIGSCGCSVQTRRVCYGLYSLSVMLVPIMVDWQRRWVYSTSQQ